MLKYCKKVVKKACNLQDNKKVKKLVDFVLFCDIIFVVRLGKGKTLYVLPSTITQQKGGQEKVCQMSSLKKTSL